MNEQYEYHFSGPAMPQSYAAPVMPEKPEKKGLGLRIFALALVCAILGGAVGAGLVTLFNSAPDATPVMSSNVLVGQRESGVINVVNIDTSTLLTEAEVYALNVNSTVGITTAITVNYWGYQTQASAAGSGFILSADGYILTNYHVIEDSDSVTVTLYDGTAYEAEIVGYDESNDIAVLKVEAEDLSPVVLGDSDNINVGDPVVAIGNPLGELTFSLTGGRISALDREITVSGGVTMDLLQTDCAINSGNSGGALFNLHGEVVGITNAKYSGSGSSSQASIDNIGFAIPINQVRGIVQSIIEKGYIVKPYIGVSISNVSEEARRYGLPAGAAVMEVTEDAPAGKAGLLANDIITAVNGVEIGSSDALVDIVGAASAGDTLVLTVYRQGETLELTVEVGEQIRSALPEKPEKEAEPQQSWPGSSGIPGYGNFPWGFFGY